IRISVAQPTLYLVVEQARHGDTFISNLLSLSKRGLGSPRVFKPNEAIEPIIDDLPKPIVVLCLFYVSDLRGVHCTIILISEHLSARQLASSVG
ncbi:hypothetical protein AB4341_14370, partial [Vibrio breoganii]